MAADAVLVDLDGTVWDSWPWYARCIGGTREASVARAEAALRSGSPVANLLRGAGGERRFGNWCRNQGSELAVYADAAKTLTRLRQRGRPLGAVTNLPGWIALPMLDGVGLATVFGAVVTYLRPPKPQPRCLLQALHVLDVLPSPRVWYVGDTDVDREAARRAGVSFAWASWGYAEQAPTSCDRELRRFGEVLDL